MDSLRTIPFRNILVGAAGAVVVIASILGGAAADRLFGIKPLDKLFPPQASSGSLNKIDQRVVNEESVVIDVADRVSPSVVTISQHISARRRIFEFSPFDSPQGNSLNQPQDIGTGFIISSDGLIATNKHVVSENDAKYRVITKDDKEFDVQKIYRDPVNDLAILKIDSVGTQLKPVEMGDSSNLKVGQFVVAIGTALGEFRHTVTTGVISGLGRGINAGTPFEGSTEHLENVIQTSAAINPGNSGGPLLNSAGQVIGVNVAIAAGAQNVGFAIPINVIKSSIQNFEITGKFSRPFLGVSYQMINKKAALIYEVPQGAYVLEVTPGSPADKVGVKADDVITKVNDEDVRDENGGLAALINKRKVGDKVKLEVWRDKKTIYFDVVLTESSE